MQTQATCYRLSKNDDAINSLEHPAKCWSK